MAAGCDKKIIAYGKEGMLTSEKICSIFSVNANVSNGALEPGS